MLDFTLGSQVYLACGVTDLRRSINGLAIIVKLQFNLDPYSRAHNKSIYDFIENESKTICEMITLLSYDEIIEMRQPLSDILLEILDSRLTEVASEFRYALSQYRYNSLL